MMSEHCVSYTGKVKRTERGWPGHYICAHTCLFRRNTLLEYMNKKWIVSTVGNKQLDNKPDMIGADRWYETKVFEAELVNGYWDVDVSKEIQSKQDWGIWGNTWEEVEEKYRPIDNSANEMHERIVDEMTERIVEDSSVGPWLPVEMFLPTVGVYVLACCDDDTICMAWLNSDGTWYTDELFGISVVAWIPLPTPYIKEVSEE